MAKILALIIASIIALLMLLCCALPVFSGEIHRAIEAGDMALVQSILEKNPGAINERDDNRFRALPIHFAATAGNVEMARLLLDAGADIDAGDSDNSTALGIAAMRKHADMVAFLIERGADVNRRDRKADCPLSFAVYGRDEAIIQKLLDAGADLYFQNPAGETLLHIACPRGVAGFVKHLLDNGASIDAFSADGGTPLGYAAMQGQPEIVKLLLERGADPNACRPGRLTPLLFTTFRNQVECARLLLEAGARVNEPGFENTTPIMRAAENCSAEMVALMIERGANVNHVNDAGKTALVHAAARGAADRVKALLAANADPNLGKDQGGRTALHLAVLGGYTEAARDLIAAGADANAETPAGETPIHLALYYGYNDCAAMLAEQGARGASKKIDRSLAALGDVGAKEAVVWFLGHSGWAIKTQNHLLIFDYFVQGEDPAGAALCNGRINLAEIKDQNLVVFASHEHGDHFNPAIFDWREQIPGVSYFLGLQPQNAPAFEFMPARMEQSFGDMKLTTIHSTDAGVGMVVEVDGVTIYYAGDHANGKVGLMDEFTDEIDFLAAKGVRPDICFMGIRGCSLGTPEEVKEGVYYTLQTLKPKVFIPMHAGAEGHIYRTFIDECRGEFASIQMAAPENRGDHFVYGKGKIKDPRNERAYHARAR